jgi:hypothetical protein
VTTVVALIGSKGLYLLYAWLAGAIGASWLSERKGYGEKAGLTTGLLTSLVAILIWLLWPAKADSKWKLQGPVPRRGGGGQTVAEARAKGVGDDSAPDPPETSG